MAADLGSAYVNIVPKAPGIKNNIEGIFNSGASGAQKSGESLGKKLIAGLAAAGVGVAVGKILKSAFTAGGDLEQSFGGLETIYGKAAGAAQEYARAAAAAGISSNSYAEQAVSFGAALKAAFKGNTTKAMKAANTAILDMADNAAKMGTPLESIQAAYQGFARGQYQLLDNLKLGYGGTKTEMERLLKDAQQVTGVKYDINNLGDVYSAIHVIQGELGLTGVAAAEAKTTLTGSLGAVKASWTNLMAAMTTGEGLESALASLGTSVGDLGRNVLKMLGSVGEQLPALLTGLVTDVAPQIIPLAGELIGGVVNGLFTGVPQLITAFGGIVQQGFESIRQNAPGMALRGIEMVRSLALGIVQGIPDMVAGASGMLMSFMDTILYYAPDLIRDGGVMLEDLLAGIMAALPEISGTILTLISSVSESLTANAPRILTMGATILQHLVDGVIEALPQLAETALTLVTSLAGAVVENLPQIVSMGIELLRGLVQGLLSHLPELLAGAAVLIANLVAALAGALPDLLQSGVELLGAVLEGILSAVVLLIRDLPEVWNTIIESCKEIDWLQLGKDIIDGIVKGIKKAGSAIGEAIRKIVRGGLKAGQDEAQTGSPSRLFANELGRWIPEGIAMGAEDNVGSLDRAMRGMMDGSLTAAQGSLQPAPAQNGDDADRIIAALQQLVLRADVTLEGDARGLFKVVKNQNAVRTKATNYNALAAGG